MTETVGSFHVLNTDTTFTIEFPDSINVVSVSADVGVLDIIANETRHVIHYEYLCNEQLASKLIALLTEKQICEYKHVEFVNEDHIINIIKKLEENQNSGKLWGWWNVSNTSYWISSHVINALYKAKEMGYKVSFKTEELKDILILNMTRSESGAYILNMLEMLDRMDIVADYPYYIEKIEADTTLSLYYKFKLIELKQKHDFEYSLDSVNKFMHETLFGSIYFDNSLDNYHVYGNPIQLTLSAYRILQHDSVGNDTLVRIRNYFLERRKNGYWRNTYESAEIIRTLLPSLLSEDDPKKPELFIEGMINKHITEFPFNYKMDTVGPITIKKTSNFPVFFSTFTQFWNPAPERKDDIFQVNSTFYKDGYVVDTLEAGKKIILEVSLLVKKDADYVMLEIPIPAGCSYGDKKQNGWNEIHREYFKNYTAIFCEHLNEGRYTFNIELIPRYTGIYTLNPAKAEQMYFPVFYGRNELKEVNIGW